MNYGFLKNKVFQTLGLSFDGPLRFIRREGLYVQLRDGAATVGADTEPGFCRGLTELLFAVKEGRTGLLIEKHPSFAWCGPMLDVSRDGVLKVETVCRYLDLLACFGMNMLMLYTEDTYEMKKYPFFGHKRGRYSPEELRAIDSYAIRRLEGLLSGNLSRIEELEEEALCQKITEYDTSDM